LRERENNNDVMLIVLVVIVSSFSFFSFNYIHGRAIFTAPMFGWRIC